MNNTNEITLDIPVNHWAEMTRTEDVSEAVKSLIVKQEDERQFRIECGYQAEETADLS